MSDLIALDVNELNKFNYSQLDENTSNELKEITIELLAINSSFKYSAGQKLAKAQELLAKKGYGCFTEWFESYGLKKDKAYDLIKFYKVFIGNPDKQEELKQLSASKIYEIGKLKEEQQKDVLENVNLKDMTAQEVKELTKQLKAEQEYSNELQEAIKEKDKKIEELKQQNQPKIIEKEVIKEVKKEVIPEGVQQQIEQLEKERDELFNNYEKAKSTIVSMNNAKNNETAGKYYDYGFDMLSAEIASFIRNASKYTYMEQEYTELSTHKKTLLKNGIKKVEDWLLDMKKAMNETLMIGNNIYIEEEKYNE